MPDLAFRAMQFAIEKHKDQKHKYTHHPYTEHLAEVAGVVASVADNLSWRVVIATAWLHGCIEDQGVTQNELAKEFGWTIASGVKALSDFEKENCAERKIERLAKQPAWIQNIKVADIISNTSNITQNDPVFAVTFLREKSLLLDALTQADPRLLTIARNQIGKWL